MLTCWLAAGGMVSWDVDLLADWRVRWLAPWLTGMFNFNRTSSQKYFRDCLFTAWLLQ